MNTRGAQWKNQTFVFFTRKAVGHSLESLDAPSRIEPLKSPHKMGGNYLEMVFMHFQQAINLLLN